MGITIALQRIRMTCVWLVWLCTVTAAGAAWAQFSAPTVDYYEACRSLGYIPGTFALRRCIALQQANDLDPWSAAPENVLDFSLPPPAPGQSEGLPGDLPAETYSQELLQSPPEKQLLGPDYRALGQGIYE
jgi:hypothetical protein